MSNISYIIIIVDLNIIFLTDLNYEYIIFSLLFYFISSQIHLCLHEIGHFIGGYLTGYKLLYIHILIFRIDKNKKGNYNFSISSSVSGECVMIPCININGDIPYFWYNSSGLIFNFMFGIIGLILSFIHNGFLSNFFLQMAFAGFFKFSINIASEKKHYLTDGYVLKTLYKNPRVKFDYYQYIQLFAHYYLNEKFQLSNYTYARKSEYRDDDLTFYLEIKKLLRLLNREDGTNGK